MVTESMYSTFVYAAETQKALWCAHVMLLGEGSSYCKEHQPTFDGLIMIAHSMESSAFPLQDGKSTDDYRCPIWELLAMATNVVFPDIAAKDVVTTGLQLLFHMQSLQEARQHQVMLAQALQNLSRQPGEKNSQKFSIRSDKSEKKHEKDFPFLSMLNVSIRMLEAFMKKDHR